MRGMSKWKVAFASAAVTAVLTVSVVVHSQQAAASKSKPVAKADSSQVHSIVLPKYPPDIPQGPNVEIYSKDCLLCHTARYVAMQPRFPKSVWQSEVKKMVDAYGAPIPDADQALIVEYLVAVKGVEAPASEPAQTK
jgi:sulfite dehydrogenase (cytochrome) subunit B